MTIVTLTDEQRLLQETARQFVAKTCPPKVAHEWDERNEAPADLLVGMADMGWFALPYPEESGGHGGGPVEVALIAEELGRASFDVAMCYIANLVAGLAVHRAADERQRAEIFPDILSGRRRFSVSLSEPDAGSDLSAIRTRARRDGDVFVLDGEKSWCTGAGLPDTVLAMYVRTDGVAPSREGLSLLLVDPRSDGVTLRRIPTLARHILGTYEVVLTGVRVPAGNLIGPLNDGWSNLLSGLAMERVLISGAYVGAAQQTVDEAIAYARQREQFGRPIGDFQVLAHMLADLQTEVDAARLLVYRAAQSVADGARTVREGAMAKLFASETYVKAARCGMQVWGGYGFSTESIMSFRYRESIVATISGGTSQIQRNAIARDLGLRPR